MAEKWIQKAIKNPGALHKALKVPAGQKIPASKIAKAAKSSNPTLAKRANPTTVKSSGQTLPSPAVGSGSSSIVYTGAGGGNVTLPTIPTNGEGQFFVVSNPSSGTLTINTSSSQTIKGAGTSGTSITIAANTNVVLLSQYDGTTKFWARV